jgi:cholesterol oxidase
VLSFADLRHWSERTAIMLCMQTTDTSLDLYWHHSRLRSRQGSGTPPSVHIPVAEEFADRLAKKVDSRRGAILTEVITAPQIDNPIPVPLDFVV